MNRWILLIAALLVACGDEVEVPLPPDPAVAEIAGEIDGAAFAAADALFAATAGFVTIALPDFAQACGPVQAGDGVRSSSTLTLQLARLTGGTIPAPFQPGLYRVVGPEDLETVREGNLPQGDLALATFERLDDQCAKVEPTEELRQTPVGGFVRIFEADLQRNVRGRVELEFFGGTVVGEFTAVPCAIPVSIPGMDDEDGPPATCR